MREKKERGLTLIELLVVAAIMIVITTLVLANNNRFGGNVQLQNLAYDVALTVREAQVFGISVQRFSGSTFARAYGVHFRQADSGSTSEFAIFADVIGDTGLYDCPDPANADPATCELVKAYEMRSGYRIASICAPKTEALPCTHAQLDVTYQRPDPDAYIRADGLATLYQSARLYITSPQGNTLSVTIEENGQITVEPTIQ